MHVPIHDRDAPDAEPLLCVTRGERDIVHDAKSHPARRARVVPRRTHEAECRLRIALHHGIRRREHAAHRSHRRIPRMRTHAGVAGAELRRAGADFALCEIEIRSGVDEQQILALHRAGRDIAHLRAQARFFQRGEHGIVSRRLLGVPGAGGVFPAYCIGGKDHAASASHSRDEVNPRCTADNFMRRLDAETKSSHVSER